MRFRSLCSVRKPLIGSNSWYRSIVTNCRAVVLPRFGGPEVLEIHSNLEVPDLKPNQVLVRARAVSVNPLDTRVRSELDDLDVLGGTIRSGYGRSIFEPLVPVILGRDISGEVAAVGRSVTSLRLGKKSLGHYILLPSEDASAIPFAALTAWRALRSTARISEGHRVLVIGGGGAVGFSAIQLAVAVGCHVVTTCAGQSIEQALAAGAEQAVDYTIEDMELAIKGQFDAVLDTIGTEDTERAGINLTRKGGHYMTLQGEAASLADRYGLALGLPLSSGLLWKKQLQYWYSHGIDYSWTYMRADAEGLDEIRRLLEAGKLKVPVEKTFPIEQVREAHEAKDKRLIHVGCMAVADEHLLQWHGN
ncbi:hypothetical protein Scep_028145 [Stephania cephalantha]|uniref:Enoyl reductase (ER) domain-containing protein n=1 Tax=Stephania cephalantha TaxID=152367 RepID=A0AAP0EGQ7_9MAGN